MQDETKQTSERPEAPTSVVALGDVVYPEAPRWHEGELWFSDVHAYAVKAVRPGGAVRTVVDVPGRPGGLGFAPDGSLLVMSALDAGLHRLVGDRLEQVADLAPLTSGLLNDMVVDAAGRAYIGDTGFVLADGEPQRPGRLLLVEPGSPPQVVNDEVVFPNGCVIDEAGGRLLLAETFARRISSFAIRPDGTLGPRELFADLGTEPDGLCSDGQGGLWVALLLRGEFAHLDAEGTVVERVRSPGALAVACAQDGESLYLCSADGSLDEAAHGRSTGRIDAVALAATPERPSFNPLDPDYLRDPYPILEQARHEQPVFFAPSLGLWVVTRYDDLVEVTRNWQVFSQSAARLLPVPPELSDRISAEWFEEAFMNADPPVHTVARKAVNAGFTRRGIAAMEPTMRETAHRLIDAFVADGQCEFMGQYAYPMGATTLAQFVGLPVSDMPRLKAWAQDLLILAYPRSAPVSESGEVLGKEMDHDELVERWTRMAECREYLHGLVAQRRSEPREDLISTLVQLEDDAGRPALSDDRLVTHLIDLIAAGTDTVAPLTAQILKFLLADPEQLAAVRADPSLLEGAVEEGLRARGTGNLLLRYTTAESTLSGVTIPAGAVVGLSYASGGRDEEHFACPHQFDVRRENASDHLAFGRGRHFCVGAPLARAQARVSVQAMLERLPELGLVADQQLEYHAAVGVFMLKAIEFEWDAAQAGA